MYFTVEEGDCEVTETGCVNSPFYPANHNNNEYCRITVHKTGPYHLGDPFEVEQGFDSLTVAGTVKWSFCEACLCFVVRQLWLQETCRKIWMK